MLNKKLKRHERIIFALAILVVLSTSTLAWYNDTLANDSQLVMQSDKETYPFSSSTGEFTVQLYVENPSVDFDGSLAIFFQNKDLEATIIRTGVLDRIKITTTLVQKVCDRKLTTSIGTTAKNAIHGACSVDVNAKRDVVVWEDDFNLVSNNIGIKNVETQEKIFRATTFPTTTKTLPYDVTGFSKKSGYIIPVKHGANYYQVTIKVPSGIIHSRSEFVFTLKNPLNPLQFSTLHPNWWETCEITPDAHTLMLIHANENAGTTAEDATANNYDVVLSNAGIWDATTKKWGTSSLSPNDLYYGTQATIFDSAVPAAWTIGVWVAPTVLHNSDVATYEKLFDRYTPTDKRLHCSWLPNTGVLRCYIEQPTEYTVTSSTAIWAQDVWHYVQLIYDGANLELWVDGGMEATVVAANFPAENTELVLGANLVYGQQSHFRMDEFDISDVDRTVTPYTCGGAPAVEKTATLVLKSNQVGVNIVPPVDFNFAVFGGKSFFSGDLNVGWGLNVGRDANINGSLKVDGNYGAYGELWKSYHSKQHYYPALNTYVMIGGDWNAGDSWNCKPQPDLNRIDVNQSGVYEIKVSGDLVVGANNATVDMAIFKNGGFPATDRDIHLNIDLSAADVVPFALSGIKRFVAGDYIDLRSEQTAGVLSSISISNVNFSIVRIG